MIRNYLIHTKENGNMILNENDIISNAQEQERNGINPHYSFWDYKKNESITPAGWLVWSTLADGCGVVYKGQQTGQYHIVTGWQGEFMYI